MCTIAPSNASEPAAQVPNGLGSLDDLLAGEWKREALYISAGRPGMCKTALTLTCALEASVSAGRRGYKNCGSAPFLLRSALGADDP